MVIGLILNERYFLFETKLFHRMYIFTQKDKVISTAILNSQNMQQKNFQAPENKGPGYPDPFSNGSVFISLHFQIDPLCSAYSNVCVFVIFLIFSV